MLISKMETLILTDRSEAGVLATGLRRWGGKSKDLRFAKLTR